MSTILALLADVMAASTPTAPELELASPAGILGDALGAAIPVAQLAGLSRALAGGAAEDPTLLTEAARLSMLASARATEPYLSGLAELLALRGLIAAGPAARGRIVLRAASAFAVLRRLSLAPAAGHPPVILVGGLIDRDEIDLGHPPGGYPLLAEIRVAFDATEAHPLLTINAGFTGPQVPWQSERERWRQPLGDAGRISVVRRTKSCTIITERCVEPYTIVGAQLAVQVVPTADVHLYTTTVLNERSRPLIVYLRASAPITPSA